MEQGHRIFRVRLDFLYRSIAVYAAVFAVSVVFHALVGNSVFPIFWEDPILILLGAITIISVLALLYNILLDRQLHVGQSQLILRSKLKDRVFKHSDVTFVQIHRLPREAGKKTGARLIRIGITSRKRPIRIRPGNFVDPQMLVSDIKQWAGPLLVERKKRGLNLAAGRERRAGRGPKK